MVEYDITKEEPMNTEWPEIGKTYTIKNGRQLIVTDVNPLEDKVFVEFQTGMCGKTYYSFF